MKKISPLSFALPFAHPELTGSPLQSLGAFFMTNRKRLEKIYGNLYKIYDTDHLGVCIYCGEKANALDHCPPLSIIESINIENYKKDGGKFRLYPSCRQCNSYLGKYPEVKILYRISYLIFKYEKRITKMAYWSDDELKEMGIRMRQFIKSKMYKYDTLNNKLVRLTEKISDENYLKMIDHEIPREWKNLNQRGTK